MVGDGIDIGNGINLVAVVHIMFDRVFVIAFDILTRLLRMIAIGNIVTTWILMT